MSDIPNSEEQTYWSGPSGQSWIRHEAAQDRLLSEILRTVLDRADLSAGERFLDIGCGTGALSVAAAQATGPTGRGLTTDISQPLLRRAAARLRQAPHVSTLLADAEVAEWPETGFDVALSRLGVMFFAHPPRAFANIASALRSGGRMVFAAWAPVARNPYWRDPARLATDRLGDVSKTEPNTPGPMGMADADWSLAQLRSAGLENVACEEVEVGLPIDGSAEDAADLALAIGPAARVVRLHDASPADVAAIRDDIAHDMKQYRDGGTVRIPAVLNLYTARVR